VTGKADAEKKGGKNRFKGEGAAYTATEQVKKGHRARLREMARKGVEEETLI